MYEEKNKTLSFRTSKKVDEKLKSLAKRVSEHQWEFPWGSKIREASTKSGLIHQLLLENITLDEVRNELQKVEAK